ncbi:hypothetical protein FPK32_23365, partial [Acinetobacter baumannii]|nr:hypothetical protein [Acinetobacter baumannii]
TDSPIFVVQEKKIVWGLDPASDSVEITNIVDADDESTYKSIDDFFESLKATDKHALNGLAIEEEDELFLDVKRRFSKIILRLQRFLHITLL